MAERDAGELPRRLIELDKRTIEWLARQNEEERERLIELSHFTPKQLRRLQMFLSLPDDKWRAGFRIVTRSVILAKAVRSVPKFVLYLSGLLIALNQIWAIIAPYLLRAGK